MTSSSVRLAQRGWYEPALRGSSTILAIQQILHSVAASGIRSFVTLPPVGRPRRRIHRFIFAALRTAIREPRFPRFQLKLLPAHHANFYRKCHCKSLFLVLSTEYCVLTTNSRNT